MPGSDRVQTSSTPWAGSHANVQHEGSSSEPARDWVSSGQPRSVAKLSDLEPQLSRTGVQRNEDGAQQSGLLQERVVRSYEEPESSPLTRTGLDPEQEITLNGEKGKLIFEPVKNGNAEAAQESLLERLANEETGDSGSRTKRYAKKFLKAVSTALDFVMHNRKFQVGVGMVGIGVFVALGCVFPIALIGVVPSLLIFTCGFLDTPDAFLPSQPPQLPPAGGTPPVDKGKDKPTTSQNQGPDDPRPAPLHKTTQTTDSPADAMAFPDLDKANARRHQESLDDRRKTEDAAQQIQQRIEKAGVEAQVALVPAPVTCDTVQHAFRSMVENRGYERQEQFDITTYLASDACFGSQGELVQTLGVEQARQVESSLNFAIQCIRKDYRLEATDSFPTSKTRVGESCEFPSIEEWGIFRDALVKNCIDQLIDFANQNGRLPSTFEEKKALMMTPDHLVARAARALGLPFTAESAKESSLCKEKHTAALNNWYSAVIKPDKLEQPQFPPLDPRSN
ncbi:MAG: hypothetical protein OXC07_07485 [Kistimonas sp.]|nr:hypothetical protein [Kistimonas sp.]